MTEPVNYLEEECFSVYWKIKNFSYFCKIISSPEFSVSGDSNRLMLGSETSQIVCEVSGGYYNPQPTSTMQISFLTCDGSPEESISSALLPNTYLKLARDVIFGKRRDAFLPEDTLTVRVRFRTGSEGGKLLLYSQIGVTRKYFLWTLKDFSKHTCFEKKCIEKFENLCDLNLIFKSMDGINPTERFGIELYRSRGRMCVCVLRISVLDADGKAVNEVRDEFVFKDGNSQTRWFPITITKSQLLAFGNLLLPNDALSLKCEFGISSGTVSDQNVFTSWCEDFGKPFIKHSDDVSMIYNDKIYPAFVPELQTHLKSILDSGTLHDVGLQIGSEVVPAHKNILSARSPVFRAMFTKDMAEAISNTVVIEDLSVETVLKLLLYMYTDTIQDYPWETMKELYSAADKYEVLSLKEKCVSFLKAKLSISNVCDALILADLHQDEDLEMAVVDYISECDSAFFVSKEWKELEKNYLPFAFKVMRKICCNKRIRLN